MMTDPSGAKSSFFEKANRLESPWTDWNDVYDAVKPIISNHALLPVNKSFHSCNKEKEYDIIYKEYSES